MKRIIYYEPDPWDWREAPEGKAKGPGATELMLRWLSENLPRYSYRYNAEKDLHDGIARVLTQGGVAFEREHTAGADRFDFLVLPSIALEVKVAGALSQALIQVERYTHSDDVSAVVLVSTKRWWQSQPARMLVNGKPVVGLHLSRQAF